jgi:two-component system sensor histidine kinase AlgZ
MGAARPDENFFLPDLCKVGAVLFLVLLAELLALVLSLAADIDKGFSWESLALTSLFAQWVVLSSAALLCLARPTLARLSLPWAAAASYLVILLVAMVCSLAGQYLDLSAHGPDIELWRTVDHLLITAILAGIMLRYFYLQQQLRLQQEAELRSRIEALQARIRPHFLFNSMNSIASLIGSDPQLAEQVVEDLADLFRQSLATDQTEVSLLEEVELCRRFVRIEALRLGRRLQVDWHIDELPAAVKIPRFTLQPLIENAIYHGIQPLPEGGQVRVAVSLDGAVCRLQVDNPVAAGVCAPSGNRMALHNISHRLKALYGPAAEIKVMQGEASFSVAIAYPVNAMSVV